MHFTGSSRNRFYRVIVKPLMQQLPTYLSCGHFDGSWLGSLLAELTFPLAIGEIVQDWLATFQLHCLLHTPKDSQVYRHIFKTSEFCINRLLYLHPPVPAVVVLLFIALEKWLPTFLSCRNFDGSRLGSLLAVLAFPLALGDLAQDRLAALHVEGLGAGVAAHQLATVTTSRAHVLVVDPHPILLIGSHLFGDVAVWKDEGKIVNRRLIGSWILVLLTFWCFSFHTWD